MNGLYFALRGGKEHRQLRHHPSQIQLVVKPGERAYLVYREDISKNHQGGLKNRKIKPKIVMHHANIENPRRCFVRLYKLYNSLCPPNRPNNTFYLQPLQKPIKDLYYSTKPVGHIILEKTVSRMCREAGILGHYTNHSLRATAATRLHQSGVEVQEIMERTGHRSTEVVRSYKITSNDQQEKVSDILSNVKRHCGEADVAFQHSSMTNFQPTKTFTSSHLSLEYASSSSAPIFNISNCSSVSINYSK